VTRLYVAVEVVKSVLHLALTPPFSLIFVSSLDGTLAFFFHFLPFAQPLPIVHFFFPPSGCAHCKDSNICFFAVLFFFLKVFYIQHFWSLFRILISLLFLFPHSTFGFLAGASIIRSSPTF